MNIFYAPPGQIHEDTLEITGREAHHASRVLRYGEGDAITVVDGEGGWFEGEVGNVYEDILLVKISKREKRERPLPRRILGLAIIKKRDRLEFAVEKAVELGASEIALFRSEHTVKGSVNIDRIESIALSAMKQSLRCWLPEIRQLDSLDAVLQHYADCDILAAHEKSGVESDIPGDSSGSYLLLVGPEGGFADGEIKNIESSGGRIVSLGKYRLRAETAAIVFLGKFIAG
ncbi:MAG: RsmE family RNA methyltransferase [Balneolaceae bacterium]|nr:RsmE family RNA methyltransferase [Balneolaceae bacterium]